MEIIKPFVVFLKRKIDNLYYRKDSLSNREELLRKTFPGTSNVWSYNDLNSFLLTLDIISQRQLVNALMSFYWWEIATLHMKKKFDEVAKYEGIPIFCSLMDAYVEELNISNSK